MKTKAMGMRWSLNKNAIDEGFLKHCPKSYLAVLDYFLHNVQIK